MAAIKWEGVFPAVTTKFHANEELDHAEMEKHFSFMIDSGCHGLVTCGSLGEASTLSFEEKLAVAKTAVKVANGRVPVLANVSETRTANAERYVKEARDLGVDGFMVMPSVLYAADAFEAKANLRTIAKAAKLPIMVYNNPVTYKVDLTPADFKELSDCEELEAIKESTDNVRRVTDLRNVVGDRYAIFMGVDDLSFEGLAVGADGLLAGLVVAFPKETVALYKLMKAGRYAEALKLYQWFMPLLHLDVSTKLVQNLKLVEALVGVGNEIVRRPRQPLRGADREYIVQVVQQALASRPDVSAYL